MGEVAFRVDQYVKHRQADGIGRIVAVEGDKIAVRWGNKGTTKYAALSFGEHFVVVSQAAKGSKMADPTMHLAVKLNYNDAGYRGICSYPVIEANRAKNQIWCSQSGCWNLQKKGGHLPRYSEPVKGWPCDEARVFSDFMFSTGGSWLAEQKGNTGKDLVMSADRQQAIKNKGRLAFMTTRVHGVDEKQRYVFGIYEIGDVIDVQQDDGKWTTCIHAVEDKSFHFDPGVQLAFWSVYQNRKPGELWGQGLHRFLHERQALEFLDMAIRKYRALKGPVTPKRRRHISILETHLQRLTP